MADDVNKKRVRAFVESCTRLISAQLKLRCELDDGKATEIARDIAHDICIEHGGQYMYVAKDLEFALSARDMEIYRRLNRHNMQLLVREYGITHTRIYQIAAQVRKAEIARNQVRLPGFDDPQPRENST